MGNLRRYYYNNKSKIWKIILIIASILLIIQFFNNLEKNKNKEILQNSNDSNNIQNTTVEKNETIISSDKSAVGGNKIEQNKLNEDVKIIEEFFKLCNNKKYEEAYKIISNSCKEEFYKNVSEFKDKYIKNIFRDGSKKIASVENWFSNTYKISISENILATGNINSQIVQDYITIVREDGEKKLNLNSFIAEYEMNKTAKTDNITTTVLSRKIFMDYEEYTIRIDNKTEGAILLDTMQSTKSIYLLDNNNMKYYSYSHEILDNLLKINKGFSTQLTIKFSKSFSSTRTVEQLVFSDVILNYNGNIDGNTEREKLYIEI